MHTCVAGCQSPHSINVCFALSSGHGVFDWCIDPDGWIITPLDNSRSCHMLTMCVTLLYFTKHGISVAHGPLLTGLMCCQRRWLVFCIIIQRPTQTNRSLQPPHADWTDGSACWCWSSKHRCSSQNPLQSDSWAGGWGQSLRVRGSLWTRRPSVGEKCNVQCSVVWLSDPLSLLSHQWSWLSAFQWHLLINLQKN